MKLKLLIALIAIAALPVSAQAQKANVASAKRVVALIKADKAKTEAYCDMGAVSDELEEAEQKKDNKKMDELAAELEELEKKLGPEYASLMDGLQNMQPNSKEAEAISAVLGELDKLCEGSN